MTEKLTQFSQLLALLFFSSCVSAQTFQFSASGETITSCTGCNGMAITIPSDNAGTAVTVIAGNAFEGYSLVGVVIPNTVTTIGTRAFRSNNLSSVSIPNSVTTIGAQAFLGNDLISVTFEGNRPAISAGAFAANVNLGSVGYSLGAIGWPGADIAGITPTVSAAMSSPTAVPTLPHVFLVILSLCMGLAAYKRRALLSGR